MTFHTPGADPFLPKQIIVTLVLGRPGALAIFGDDGIPCAIEPLSRVRPDKLFAPTSPLTQTLHLLPDVGALAKVVVCAPDSDVRDGALDLRSRSGTGYLVHLLKWFRLPVIVTDTSWRVPVEERFGARPLVEILKAHFPPSFEAGHRNEACAQAALLSYIALTNPDWQGLNLSITPRPWSSTGAIPLH